MRVLSSAKQLSLTVELEHPDKVGIVSTNGGGGYGSFSPFGLTGGYYYTRVGYKY